jgi:hypothetical protein
VVLRVTLTAEPAHDGFISDLPGSALLQGTCSKVYTRRGGKKTRSEMSICGSLERHRLMWLYLTQKTGLFDGKQKRMLHIAPEPELSRLIQKADYINYLSADLSAPDAMVKMDITDIQSFNIQITPSMLSTVVMFLNTLRMTE